MPSPACCLAAPFATPQPPGCRADSGPRREVQAPVDERVAGIAASYTRVYTGGRSPPDYGYVIPAPRIPDISPLRFEPAPSIGPLDRTRLPEGDARECAQRRGGGP